MRHGYLRPDEAAISAAEKAILGKSSAEIAKLVEAEGRTFDKVMEEASVDLDLSKVKAVGGATNDDKADNITQLIAKRKAGMNILAAREEKEAAQAENETAKERLDEYRRGPRLYTPEQVRELASANGSRTNTAPQQLALVKAVNATFKDTAEFHQRLGAPFSINTGVDAGQWSLEPTNAITPGNAMQSGDGDLSTQANVGLLRFPPLQADLEYYARRQASVFQFLSSRVTRNLDETFGGGYRYRAETAPSENKPAFRAQANSLARRKFASEIRTANMQICGAWVPVAREEFMDVVGFGMFINTTLRDDIMLEVDDALLNGDGSGSSITGLNELSGVNAVAQPAAAGGNPTFGVTSFHKAMTDVFTNGHAMVDFAVMHPTAWHGVRTQRDSQHRLLIGGEQDEVNKSLFGVTIIVTPAQGTATEVFLGTSMKLMLLQQGGLMLEWTNAHDDGFEKMIDAIRGYCRLGLVDRRALAHAKITNFEAEKTA